MSTSDSEGDGFRAATLEFLDSLYGAALRLTRNADRTQDLVQDTTGTQAQLARVASLIQNEAK